MQSYEEAPPPYPGTIPNATSNTVRPKGDYRSVPVYEVSSNDTPIYNEMSYQQVPVTEARPILVGAHAVPLGRNPIHCICPHCHQQVVTRVDYYSGSFAWLMCLLLTVIGCIPCCVIPFCATSCQDVTHICPYCSMVVGRRKIL
ncbi:unnamed protein product [Rotaria sordida]|uniref:LITAF domain-containing protein n=1 Tax=Rotaria sordida TaxID=392033 RepID=A0A818NWR0_9BILA|nr:unnamed protein product [Rotaria sordida]